MKRDLTEIKKIIIHCSDSPFGDSGLIDRWHRGFGWRKIGYHHVVLNGWTKQDDYDEGLVGALQDGRELVEVGAHCKGHNDDSIGICMIGVDDFSLKQMERLRWLVRLYAARFRIQIRDVLGHGELNKAKTCPNIDMARFRASLVED